MPRRKRADITRRKRHDNKYYDDRAKSMSMDNYVHCSFCGNDNNQGMGFDLCRIEKKDGEVIVSKAYKCRMCGLTFAPEEDTEQAALNGTPV